MHRQAAHAAVRPGVPRDHLQVRHPPHHKRVVVGRPWRPARHQELGVRGHEDGAEPTAGAHHRERQAIDAAGVDALVPDTDDVMRCSIRFRSMRVCARLGLHFVLRSHGVEDFTHAVTHNLKERHAHTGVQGMEAVAGTLFRPQTITSAHTTTETHACTLESGRFGAAGRLFGTVCASSRGFQSSVSISALFARLNGPRFPGWRRCTGIITGVCISHLVTCCPLGCRGVTKQKNWRMRMKLKAS